MKVLLISSMYPSPGNPALGVFVRRQVELLRDLGVQITLAICTHPSRKRVVSKYLQLTRDVWSRRNVPFDLVHVHWPVWPGVLGALAARQRRCPLVVTAHGSEIDPESIRSRGLVRGGLTRMLCEWSLRRADHVVVVGSRMIGRIQEIGVPRERVSCIDMGVDTSLFRPQPKSEARDRLGLDPTRPVLVSVGWLVPWKGHRYLLQAMVSILQKHPSSLLCLVGSGPEETALKTMAREMGIENHVAFVGQRPADEIPFWDAAADVLVMASLRESFGLAALEGLATGTPVVASRVGGLVDQIGDGQSGFLVSPGDWEAIANRVDVLLSNPTLRAEMGARGVQSARQHDSRRQASKVLELYQQLCGVPSQLAAVK